jgi:CubicO group peptidase (beta-lactamase class C family)
LFVIAPGTRLPAQAPAATDARYEQLATRVTQAMEKYHVPGVALGIVYEGRTATRGFGVTSVEDPHPITAGTVFPIASISKTFASTAIMRLVEQHKVDLRAPVRKYLPDFRAGDEAVSREVTVWHLLTHTSGWEGQIAPADRGDDTLARFVDGMMPTDMQLAPPGAAWSYNNAGFSVAGRLLEVVTGKTIGAALGDLVFKPLRLARTVTSPREMMTYPFALGHSGAGAAAPAIVRPFAYSTSVTAGGVSTSVGDLLTYARFHLGSGDAPAAEEPVLSRATLDAMRTPQLTKQGNDDEMGIGWHLRAVGGLRTAAHGGTLNGHVLLLELVPERRFAIAILTNASNERVAARTGRRACSTAVVPRRRLPGEPGDRASRSGRDAPARRAARRAAGARTLPRSVRASDGQSHGQRRWREAVHPAGTDERQRVADDDARRLLRR